MLKRLTRVASSTRSLSGLNERIAINRLVFKRGRMPFGRVGRISPSETHGIRTQVRVMIGGAAHRQTTVLVPAGTRSVPPQSTEPGSSRSLVN